MTRNPNIAVITIGYNTQFAFEDTQAALELMALMSKAVNVDSHTYGLGDQPYSYFLAEDGTLPELKFVPAQKFNPHETVKEAKARMEREKADREDLNQQFREAPAALPAPGAPVVDDLADVDFL
jgi:hypothetical protein